MDGYVMNISNIWTHAMKRSIGPGAKVKLDELYEQYGVKHGLSEGQEFVEWLGTVKLKDKNKWKIVLGDEKNENKVSTNTIEKPTERIQTPMVKSSMEVSDIVEFSVRQAREEIPKITDLTLLRYAIQEARQRAHKDSLCKIIQKRIRELQIAR